MGLSIGSFINVLVWRLPRNESIIFPGSHCTVCNKGLNWYDNIPLISWIYLGRRCRYCNSKISIIYPITELICSITFLICLWAKPTNYIYINSSITIILGWILSSILLTITIIDIKYLWIPKSISYGGIIIGIINIFILSLIYNQYPSSEIIVNHILASLIGFIAFSSISFIGEIILRKPALGLGDAKLIALTGAWLGIKGVLIVMFLSFISAAIFSSLALLIGYIKRGDPFPFGPFISLSTFAVWLMGNTFWIKIYFY